MASPPELDIETRNIHLQPPPSIFTEPVPPPTHPHFSPGILGIFPIAKDGLQETSPFSGVIRIPPDLTRRTLQTRRKIERVPESDTRKRGRAVEVYVRDVIATQTELVESAELHEKLDEKGSDVLLRLRKGLSARELLGEIKSSSGEIRAFKKKIRNRYLIAEEGLDGQLTGPWVGKMTRAQWETLEAAKKEAIMSQLLTELGIILINGGEKDNREKTPTEILEDSFIPQLQRKLSSTTPEGNKRIGIFPQTDQLRVWRWIYTGEFTKLTAFEPGNRIPPQQETKSIGKNQMRALPEGQISTGSFTDITESTTTDNNRNPFKRLAQAGKSKLTQLFP